MKLSLYLHTSLYILDWYIANRNREKVYKEVLKVKGQSIVPF